MLFEFLREVGLIKPSASCPDCGFEMEIRRKKVSDGFSWVPRNSPRADSTKTYVIKHKKKTFILWKSTSGGI